ncbi:hypothetical protein BD779DRAFT_1673365 [Infundibulicybe gibba]|nr:hypothetical protein BD779DRAFT_1673365 [Infundibulicybe gibba]
MDVFGTVVGAIDLAVKLVGYLQAVKGAKEDRRKLLPEISALGALLQVLRGRLGNSTTTDGAASGRSFSDRLVMAGIEEPLRLCLPSQLLKRIREPIWRRPNRLTSWTLRDSTNSITKVEHAVAMIDRNQQNQGLQAVLKWLSPLDFSGKHSAAFETHPGSKANIRYYGALAVREWINCHPSLQERISEDTAVVYVYFDYTVKYTIAQLFETLLSQFMRRRATQSGMESLQSYMAGGRRPTLDELVSILRTEAETYARVFVIIDALDEADIQIWTLDLGRLRALSEISLPPPLQPQSSHRPTSSLLASAPKVAAVPRSTAHVKSASPLFEPMPHPCCASAQPHNSTIRNTLSNTFPTSSAHPPCLDLPHPFTLHVLPYCQQRLAQLIPILAHSSSQIVYACHTIQHVLLSFKGGRRT